MLDAGFFIAMTISIATTLEVKLNWTYQDVKELSTPEDSKNYKYTLTMTDGSSAEQNEAMWHDRRRLTPSTSTDDLDLYGGLTDVFGNTLNFTYVRQLIIYNRGVPDGSGGWTATAGEDVEIGNAASNPWSAPFAGTGTSKLKLPSGGMLVLTGPEDGWAVTDSSSDTLRLALNGSGSNDVDVDVIITGLVA